MYISNDEWNEIQARIAKSFDEEGSGHVTPPIEPEFASPPLTDAALERCVSIRRAFSLLLHAIKSHVPASRELSVAITKLQEAQSWAVRGVSVVPDNQKRKEG